MLTAAAPRVASTVYAPLGFQASSGALRMVRSPRLMTTAAQPASVPRHLPWVSAEKRGGEGSRGEHRRPVGVSATPPDPAGKRAAAVHTDVKKMRAQQPGEPRQRAEPAENGPNRHGQFHIP